MRTRSRKYRYGLTLLVVVLIGGVALAASKLPYAPDFLRRATYVTALDTRDTRDTPRYLWRSDHQVLIPGPQPATSDHYRRDILQMDSDSGQITRLMTVSDVVFCFRGDSMSTLSSDERWLAMALRKKIERIDLEEKRRTVWWPKSSDYREGMASNLCWLPDRSHLVFLAADRNGNGLCVVQQSLEGGKCSRGLSFGFPRLSQYWDSIGSKVLGFVGPRRMLCLPAFSDRRSSKYNGGVCLYEVSVGSSPHLVESFLSLSEGEEVLDIALSPEGQRLALLVRRDRVPPLSPLRHFFCRWWTNLQPKPQTVLTLYTMRLDGSDRHTLGDSPVKKEEEESENSYHLGWLPSGKRLSFLWRNGLWTLPAE